MKKETVLVSKCCAGEKCRYRHNGFLRKFYLELQGEVKTVTACPEQLGGLPTPREGCSVIRGRVKGRRTGRDYTREYQEGADKTLALCQKHGIKTAYLLKNSPSCGQGYGLTAKLLEANGIRVIPV